MNPADYQTQLEMERRARWADEIVSACPLCGHETEDDGVETLRQLAEDTDKAYRALEAAAEEAWHSVWDDAH